MNHHPGTTPVTTLAPPFAPEDEPEYYTPIDRFADELTKATQRRVSNHEAERGLVQQLSALQKAIDGEDWEGSEEHKAEMREISEALDLILGHLSRPGFREYGVPGWLGWDGLRVTL